MIVRGILFVAAKNIPKIWFKSKHCFHTVGRERMCGWKSRLWNPFSVVRSVALSAWAGRLSWKSKSLCDLWTKVWLLSFFPRRSSLLDFIWSIWLFFDSICSKAVNRVKSVSCFESVSLSLFLSKIVLRNSISFCRDLKDFKTFVSALNKRPNKVALVLGAFNKLD